MPCIGGDALFSAGVSVFHVGVIFRLGFHAPYWLRYAFSMVSGDRLGLHGASLAEEVVALGKLFLYRGDEGLVVSILLPSCVSAWVSGRSMRNFILY